MVNAAEKLLRWFRGSAQPVRPTASPQAQPESESSLPLFPEEINAGGEKRSVQRRSLAITAKLFTVSFVVPDSIVVQNISPQGLYFQANFKLRVGQVIQIAMTTPDTHEPVRYHAKVVRANDAGANQFAIAARITRRELLESK